MTRRLVAVLRLYRLALAERAVAADRCDRPCCALTLWAVRKDINGFLEYLTNHKEP